MRKRSIEVYLKEGVDEEDALFDIWQALNGRRRQDFFRRVIRYGVKAAIERGEIPRIASDEIDWDAIESGIADLIQTSKNRRSSFNRNENTVKTPNKTTLNNDKKGKTGELEKGEIETVEKNVVKSVSNVSKPETLGYRRNSEVDHIGKDLVKDTSKDIAEGKALKKRRLGELM